MEQEQIQKLLEKHKIWIKDISKGERADLRSADLSYADLRSANLRSANLSSANLRSADLHFADLHFADLRFAEYQIRQILSCNWKKVSDELCLEMMRWDCLIAGEEAFETWASEGVCPFEDLNIQREFLFEENANLWKPGKPEMNFVELFHALCKEKSITIKERIEDHETVGNHSG